MFASLVVLLAALLPAAAKGGASPRIFIATDLHYISPALTDHGAYFTNMVASGDGKMVMVIDEIVDAFIEEVIAAKPDCLILSGDLTFNGAKKSHEDLAMKLSRLDQAGIPVLALPGNHDLYRYSAARFEGVSFTRVESATSEDFARIYHNLGFDAAIDRDPYSLSYIAEPLPGIRILMLDTNTQSLEGGVTHSTLLWLEKTLAQAESDGAKVIAVSHHNLYAHSTLLHRGYVISNADQLLALYERYGVAVNLSGHLHIQHTVTDRLVPEIATSSLAVSPCQYGVIELSDGQAAYSTRPVNVSSWAKANGKTDKNLLSFRQYAAAFFAATASGQSAGQLKDDSEQSAMATWLANLNAAYFSGRQDLIDADSPHAGRWQESGTFFGQYVKSILAEERKDHTKLVFPL